MEKKANSFAVIIVSIIAAVAAGMAAIYFITNYLKKKNQEKYDFVDCYDTDYCDEWCDDDCCECEEQPATETVEETAEDAE